MPMERVEAKRCLTQAVIVRLFRRWVAARDQGLPTAPLLVSLAEELGVNAVIAVALDSLLQLTESCLGRPLRAECCCSAEAGADEKAVLLLIATAWRYSDPVVAPTAIPHGLPGALAWAAVSLGQLVGEELSPAPAMPLRRCPFVRSGS